MEETPARQLEKFVDQRLFIPEEHERKKSNRTQIEIWSATLKKTKLDLKREYWDRSGFALYDVTSSGSTWAVHIFARVFSQDHAALKADNQIADSPSLSVVRFTAVPRFVAFEVELRSFSMTQSSGKSIWNKMWLKKPKDVVMAEATVEKLQRHYTLTDLLALGVGNDSHIFPWLRGSFALTK